MRPFELTPSHSLPTRGLYPACSYPACTRPPHAVSSLFPHPRTPAVNFLRWTEELSWGATDLYCLSTARWATGPLPPQLTVTKESVKVFVLMTQCLKNKQSFTAGESVTLNYQKPAHPLLTHDGRFHSLVWEWVHLVFFMTALPIMGWKFMLVWTRDFDNSCHVLQPNQPSPTPMTHRQGSSRHKYKLFSGGTNEGLMQTECEDRLILGLLICVLLVCCAFSEWVTSQYNTDEVHHTHKTLSGGLMRV